MHPLYADPAAYQRLRINRHTAVKNKPPYGGLNEYLKRRIEAEVRSQKMGVGTLTPST